MSIDLRTGTILLLIALTAFAGGRAFAERTVRGRVTQVTEGQVYFDIGRAAGLRRGDRVRVTLGRGKAVELTVATVWARGGWARLPSGTRFPRTGARVTIVVARPPPVARRARAAARLDPLDAPSVVAARWANVQRGRPALVAFRIRGRSIEEDAPQRLRGTLRVEYLGLFDLGDSPQDHYQSIAVWSDLDAPRVLLDGLGYSHRLRVRFHLAHDLAARPFQASRPIPLVYRLRLSYRRPWLRARAGRFVGGAGPDAPLVDGGSVRVRVAPGVFLGAYGGVTPRAIDLRPSADGATFGAYSSGRFEGRGWALSADAGFLGTTWDGRLDRKAIYGSVSFDAGPFETQAQTVVDLYDSAGPTSVDLTLLSVSASWRAGRTLRAGARVDRYRFVPSREIQAALPADFVTQEPVTSGRLWVDLSIGDAWLVDVGGGVDHQGAPAWSGWGIAGVRRFSLLIDGDSARAALSVNRGNTLFGIGGQVGYVLPLTGWLTADAGYAVSRDAYVERSDTTLRHRVAAGAQLTIARYWSVTIDGVALLSDEERVLQLLSTAAFHF